MSVATVLPASEATSTPEAVPIPFASLIKDQNLVSDLAKLGITNATPVQAVTIPEAESGRDLIVQAQTGSGKTLAFVIPLLNMLRAAPDQRGTLAIIVTPTRELAVQVREVIASLASDISPACIIGGAKVGQQIRELRNDARVIVGTPGRIRDLIQQREIVLRKCRYFILDEADEMLSMGFIDEVRDILSKLPKPRQGLFFSATITPRVQMLAQSFLTDPKNITVAASIDRSAQIEHLYTMADGGVADKANALINLIRTQNPRSAIVFCNTKSETELLESFLRRRDFNARRINSDLSQKERDTIMKSIHAGELRLLIATDVAARGIDIEELDLVVNYTIHERHETYVHRTGRTGRAGNSGQAVMIVGPGDFPAFCMLRKSLSHIPFKELVLPPFEQKPLEQTKTA